MEHFQQKLNSVQRSGIVEILCRKTDWSGRFLKKKKKDPEYVWKQCTLKISNTEILQYYRNRKSQGEIPLSEIKDVVAFRSTNNLMYPFRVHFDGESSPWTINTHNEDERRAWMEAIVNGSTRNQWTDTQLRRPIYERADQLQHTFSSQESVDPYVDACELNIPSPSMVDEPLHQPEYHVPQVNISSEETSNESHYLTLYPPDTDNNTQEEDLPDVSPTIAYSTEFMKNFDPVQVDLMVQILLSAVNCSASRLGSDRPRMSSESLSSRHQHPTPGKHKDSLKVPSKDEDSISCMSSEMDDGPCDGPYYRLADLYISLNECDFPEDAIEEEVSQEKPSDSTNDKSVLYAPIGNLLIDQPSSSDQDKSNLSSKQQQKNLVSETQPHLPPRRLDRHNAIRYNKKKKSTGQDRPRSSSDPPDLPPPLPPKTYKDNPNVAVSKLRSVLKRASSSQLLDDEKSTRDQWFNANANAESEVLQACHEYNQISIHPLPWSAFSNVQKIGEGQFGPTYSALMTDTGLQVTLKYIKAHDSQVEKDVCLREIAVLKEMQRPSIAKLYGYISEFEGDTMIVQEFLPRGTLKDFLTHNKCSMIQLVRYMLDIAMGMHYLSDKGLIHKKLAARNILMGVNDQCKVADLSLGLKYDLTESNSFSNLSAPHGGGHGISKPHSLLRWMAPECLLRKEFSTASDVWSFGVLQWEIMMVPELPYKSLTDEEYLGEMKSGANISLSTPPDCPPVVVKNMNACWNLKPQKRPSFLYISSCLTNLILEMNIPRSFTRQKI